MENKTYKYHLGGKIEMAVNDTVEVVSSSDPDIHGAVAKIVEISQGKYGTDLRIANGDGLDVWIDSNDVSIY